MAQRSSSLLARQREAYDEMSVIGRQVSFQAELAQAQSDGQRGGILAAGHENYDEAFKVSVLNSVPFYTRLVALTAAVILLFWYWGPITDHFANRFTAYPVARMVSTACVKQQETGCPESLKAGTPQVFLVNVEHQFVELNSVTTEPVRLQPCAVHDRSNWSCWDVSVGGGVPSGTKRYISRTSWLLLKYLGIQPGESR